MPDFLSITDARTHLGGLVRHVSRTRRDRVTITVNGHPSAVLINPRALADLEATLAWHRTRQAVRAPTAAPDASA
ncbi:type II toxin-antitoxin system prevent-host-death family antitoxin [Kitasatospora phosalacinea]|uniref:type II toxin-antitoxin system prevent-host-death family antitoxin n=1 Tax=Kitasatospora phosalacinea TaxID=2065 RepID=UPI0035DC5B6A